MVRFNEGDLVLAKVAGSPFWPAIVRPCNVTDDDESFRYNGKYHRRPDLFWVLFFEDSVEPQSGIWVRSSKMRVMSYKDTPSVTDDESLLEAHKYAERYFETHRPDEVEKFKTERIMKPVDSQIPNGQRASDSKDSEDVVGAGQLKEAEERKDVGLDKHHLLPSSINQGTIKPAHTPRRSSRSRAKKSAGTILQEKRTSSERTTTSRAAKRGRVGGNAPAQKRPRRTSIVGAPEMEDGDMEMTPGELRKAVWSLRRRVKELEETIANVRKALTFPRRTK